MKLSIVGMTLAMAILWGLSMFLLALGNMQCTDGYGAAFLSVMSSIYPGYDAMPTWRSIWIGTGYGTVDGAVCGLLLSILYNIFARCACACGWCSCCKKDQAEQSKPQ